MIKKKQTQIRHWGVHAVSLENLWHGVSHFAILWFMKRKCSGGIHIPAIIQLRVAEQRWLAGRRLTVARLSLRIRYTCERGVWKTRVENARAALAAGPRWITRLLPDNEARGKRSATLSSFKPIYAYSQPSNHLHSNAINKSHSQPVKFRQKRRRNETDLSHQMSANIALWWPVYPIAGISKDYEIHLKT